ncbi:hypothetical protein DMP09_09190, partial [Eggerthella sinensis]
MNMNTSTKTNLDGRGLSRRGFLGLAGVAGVGAMAGLAG